MSRNCKTYQGMSLMAAVFWERQGCTRGRIGRGTWMQRNAEKEVESLKIGAVNKQAARNAAVAETQDQGRWTKSVPNEYIVCYAWEVCLPDGVDVVGVGAEWSLEWGRRAAKLRGESVYAARDGQWLGAMCLSEIDYQKGVRQTGLPKVNCFESSE